MRFLNAAALSVSFFTAAGGDKASGPVQFRTHVIENNMPGGYTVIVTDMNNDQRPDIIGTTINGDGRLDIVMIGGATHNIKWYENLGPGAK